MIATHYTWGALLCVAAGAAFAQNPPTTPAFDATSVKPAAPLDPAKILSGKMHVGMSIDKARVDIGNMSLEDLIRIAYRVKNFQISGPDWMRGQRFDVLATLPEGASTDQAPEMLQTLLAERFKLVVRRETKDQPVYALVVGKNGPKLKESEPDAVPDSTAPPPAQAPQIKLSNDGKGVSVSGGANGPVRMSMGPNGAMHLEAAKMNMAALAEALGRFVDRPVVDHTDIKGNYQVALDISMDEIRNVARSAGIAVPGLAPGGAPGGAPENAPVASDPSGSSIFASVQQLGLRLEPRKEPLEMIVVEHAEKMPTEN